MAVLLLRTGSVTEELTLAVSLIGVPAAVPAFTFTTYVMVAGAPGARLGSVQISVIRVQVHPAGPVSDTEMVFAGSALLRVTDVAALGPLLVTTWVYVIWVFANTGTGLGVFVIERSAESAT
jgi:hypothetical protein